MELTREERWLKLWFTAWIPVYLGGGLLFLFAGPLVLRFVNWMSATLFPSLPLISEQQGGFWIALSASMMLCISVCSIVGARDPVGQKGMAIPLAAAKIGSSLGGLWFFLQDRQFAGLVITLSDLPLFFGYVILYRAAVRSRLKPAVPAPAPAR
jgi:hypothetical protein